MVRLLDAVLVTDPKRPGVREAGRRRRKRKGRNLLGFYVRPTDQTWLRNDRRDVLQHAAVFFQLDAGVLQLERRN